MATRLRPDVAIDQDSLVACKWCGQRTRPDPACEACGSPLDRRLWIDAPAFSDDLLESQTHSQRTRDPASEPATEEPTASVEDAPDRPADDVIALSLAIADIPSAPVEVRAEIRVEALPADPQAPPLLAGRAWGVAPTPAVRSVIRKEIAKTWGTRIGGFVGLVFLLDFLVNHV